jgi:ATP-dependent helicase HrpB
MTHTDKLASLQKLPIFSHLPSIAQKLQEHKVLIVKADPGAGKTTGIPLFLHQQYRSILILQPRRLATRLTATRMAAMLDSAVGQQVGYQMRMESRMSDSTRILFITEGTFTRYINSDPLLKEWDLVILDEFHERHLQSDLALSYLMHLRKESRPELGLLVMSATLDTRSLEQFAGAPVIEIRSPSYPIEFRYRPRSIHEDISLAVKRAIEELLADGAVLASGHILVFLAGYSDIARCAQLLESSLGQHRPILPVTANLSDNLQKVLTDSAPPSILLATNVAETSITIPGITAVIDSGFEKVLVGSELEPISQLLTKKNSQASAAQRAGRAGRTAPGVCIRLYSQQDFDQRTQFGIPEIQRTDLSPMILDMARQESANIPLWRSLRWLSPPREETLAYYEKLLQHLGALDQNLKLTPFGFLMSKVSLHPRCAYIFLHAQEMGHGPQGLLYALLISEEIRLEHFPGYFGRCDLAALTDQILQQMKQNRTWNATYANLIQLYDRIAAQTRTPKLKSINNIDEDVLRPLVYTAFADRVGRKRDQRKQSIYHLSAGGEALLSEYSCLKNEPWILAIQLLDAPARLNSPGKAAGRPSAGIQMACAIDPRWLNQDPMKQMSTTTQVEGEGKAKQLFERVSYGDILLKKSPLPSLVSQEQFSANASYEEILAQIRHPESLSDYQKKLSWLGTHGIEHQLPDFSGDFLDLLQHDYAAKLSGETRGKEAALDARDFLRHNLTQEQEYFLSRLFPPQIKLPNGMEIAVDYSGDSPKVQGKIQWFFGIKSHPKICQEKLALTIVLCAPNQRPAQITSDLPGFWQGSYAQVRKELKQRYPKHDWPENPMASSPSFSKKT